jgi:hypothetical protein
MTVNRRLSSGLLLVAIGGHLVACAPRAAVPPPATPPATALVLAEAVPAPPADSSATPSPAPSSSASPSSSRLEKLHEQDDRDLARMGGWVSVSAGSLAAIVALFTSYAMLHDKSVRDSNCDATKACSSAGLSANMDLAALSGWNIGSWAVAAVGLGVGAFLVVTNPSAPDEGTRVGIAPTGSGAGLTVRSAF